MPYHFAELTMPQVRDLLPRQPALLLPFGQTEQHGLHLPIGCDNIIATRVADAVAEKLAGDAYVLPLIPYGYNPKAIQNWPSVFRIRSDIMVAYLNDVCTSAVEMGFQHVIIISTHGPHGDVARLAARDVFDRTGVPIVVSIPHQVVAKQFNPIRKSALGGTSHAGEYETALLMHFGYEVDTSKLDDRDNVKVCNQWVSGDMLGGSGCVSWSTWGLQISETGVYGDPSKATVETGRKTFDAIVERYCELVQFVRHQPRPKQTFPIYPRSW